MKALNPGLLVEEIIVRTRGDAMRDSPIHELGGKGLFVKEIEDALLGGEIDAAVHSAKDLPSKLPAGLVLASIPERADPWDALVSRGGESIRGLAPGSRIGTSSLRRIAQIRRYRRDLKIVELRGNVDTRLEKVAGGEVEAAVLAVAGLQRLGLGERAVESLAPELMLPAAGQGALATETRADDSATRCLMEALEHSETKQAVMAERAVMARLEGGCQLPLAVFAEMRMSGFQIKARLTSVDGEQMVEEQRTGGPDDAMRMAEDLAEDVLSSGGAEILKGVR